MDFFVGDLRGMVGGIQTVHLANPHFEKYKAEEFEGKKYIVGINPLTKNTPLVSFDKPNLLLSLVSLVQGDLPGIFKSDDPAKRKIIEKAIPEKRVLRFCKKFGVPYDETKPGGIPFVVEDLLNKYGARAVAAFELDHFRYRVFWLHYYFRVWQALVTAEQYGRNDRQTINEYLKRWHGEGRTGKEKIAIAKECLVRDLVKYANNIQILPSYDREKNRFVIVVRSKDLFSAAYFQFYNLLTLPGADVKVHLKICSNPKCRNLFWGHKNRKVCFFCTRQTIYKQKGRG